MLIKNIRFAHEIDNIYNDNVDVIVTNENDYSYVVVLSTPENLLEEMEQEKQNFIEPGTLRIIVKKLTKEIIEEAILTYAKDEAYGLKLHQFADMINISVLNKLEKEHIEQWKSL